MKSSQLSRMNIRFTSIITLHLRPVILMKYLIARKNLYLQEINRAVFIRREKDFRKDVFEFLHFVENCRN